MNFNVIASSSKGNCVILNKFLIIDIGISFKLLSDNIDANNLKVIVITHQHGDHLKKSTIKKVVELNPFINIICNEDVAAKLVEIGVPVKNVILLPLKHAFKIRDKINFVEYEIRPLHLYHDVPNYGYRIFATDVFKNVKKAIYCTDTGTLQGIGAKEYDYYLLETNYTDYGMARKLKPGEYDNRDRSKNYHLSREEAEDFFTMNRKESSIFQGLHKSDRFY